MRGDAETGIRHFRSLCAGTLIKCHREERGDVAIPWRT
jgi:hypothetical protein